MTPSELTAWRKRHGFTQEEAGDKLGVSKRSISGYETVGPVPKSIALACSAISNEEQKLNFTELVREHYPKLDGFFVVIPFIIEKGNTFQDVVRASFNPEVSAWLHQNEISAQLTFKIVITPSHKKLHVPIVVFDQSEYVSAFKMMWG